jgi:hypothetical protein
MEATFAGSSAYRRFSYRAPEWQDLLDRIDVEALIIDRRRFAGPTSPRLATLDTSFFYSGFQSALRYGGQPKSIAAADDGIVRLFLAEETFWELMRKLPEFADEIQCETEQLESIVADWSPLITIVSKEDFDDPRVDTVAKRDPTDRPAALLAAFLSPCFLLTTDKDFESMEVMVPRQPVLAIKAAIVAKDSETTVNAMAAIPAVPAVAAWEGAKWGGSKLGMHPVLIVIGVIVLGYAVYRFQPEDRRERFKRAATQLGNAYVNEIGSALEQKALAEKAVNAQLVPRIAEHSAESRIMHQLAFNDESMTAQQIYDAAGLRGEVSVRRIRQILTSSESTWRCPGRGRWSFGIPLDEYLALLEPEPTGRVADRLD